jgi:hypothetical protein
LGRGCGILYNVSNTSFCYVLVNEDVLCNDVLVCVGDEWNEAPLKFLVSFMLYGDVVLYFHSLYVVLHDNILFI